VFCYHSLAASYTVDSNLIEVMLIMVGFIAMNLAIAIALAPEAMRTVQVAEINLANDQLQQQQSLSLRNPSRLPSRSSA
jgi:hypothetical protein